MMHLPRPAHLLSIDALSDGDVSGMLDSADGYGRPGDAPEMAGKVVASLFFQPSTRTRLSFETAALRLGAHVVGFADPSTTRAHPLTQESYEDVVRTVSAMADVVVVRSTHADGAARAAAVAECPVVNAGDGGEHPTQALLDAYTVSRLMRHERGKGVADVHMGFVGCTVNRSTRTVLRLLLRLGVRRVSVLVEEGRGLDARTVADAAAHGVTVQVTNRLDDVLEACDVVYVSPRDTRYVTDCGVVYDDDAPLMPGRYVVNAEAIRRTSSRAYVMAPLPRRNEIATDVDDLPNSAYFRQVAFSVPVRMAVLRRVASAGSLWSDPVHGWHDGVPFAVAAQ